MSETDFNDLHRVQGLDSVKRCIEAAQPARLADPSSDAAKPSSNLHACSVELVCASDLKPEPIDWLWDGWLAQGKLHIFGGAPGTGKTTISMGLAATVTIGGRWPDGSKAPAGDVVVWSGEDDPKDTLIPRLALSGADLSRVFFISEVRQGDERRTFDPARDIEPLRRKLAEIGDVRLLVVDPIVSAIAGNSHRNAEVRRGLQPLVDMGAAMGCAVLGITHFSKGTSGNDPVERLTGSIAFGGLARVVLVAAKHQGAGDDGRTVRLFCRSKSNIGPDDGGFEYDLRQAELGAYPGIFASCVMWGDAVEGSARALLAEADATGDEGAAGDIKQFLADLLADGPMPSKAIRADAQGAGYAWRTVQRAKRALGIEAVKEGGTIGGKGQQWVWRLPQSLKSAKFLEERQECQTRKVGVLQEKWRPSGTSGTVEFEL